MLSLLRGRVQCMIITGVQIVFRCPVLFILCVFPNVWNGYVGQVSLLHRPCPVLSLRVGRGIGCNSVLRNVHCQLLATSIFRFFAKGIMAGIDVVNWFKIQGWPKPARQSWFYLTHSLQTKTKPWHLNYYLASKPEHAHWRKINNNCIYGMLTVNALSHIQP